jgi:hypothetical protein
LQGSESDWLTPLSMLPTFSSELHVCRDAALLDGAKKFGAAALVAESKCMKRAKPMDGQSRWKC